MTTSGKPELPLMPFMIVGALFLGAAAAILWLGGRPLTVWQGALLLLAVSGATGSVIYPVVRRHREARENGVTSELANAVAQINRVEAVAAQIAQASSQWQSVQENAAKLAAASQEAAKSMTGQVAQFSQVFEKANDAEKSQLKLEVDKSRRAEVEWLQVTTRLLDNIYALWLGAARSGQQNLIEQIGNFQEACREAVRRVGLVPLLVRPGEPFNPELYERANDETPLPANPVVDITLVTGFSFQGQLIRRPVVAVRPADPAQPTPPAQS